MIDTSQRDIENATQRTERSFYTRLRLAVARPVFRWTRGMTLGARVAGIDAKGRFLLVKHTYSPGWIFPGGGVEKGESCHDAAIRELWEEAAIIADGPLQLHGIHSNHSEFPGDHLAFYILRGFEQKPFKANHEIAAVRFFAVGDLPPSTTQSSLRRIREITESLPPDKMW